MRCGHNMSYCKNKCNKHFIWGTNAHNECLASNDEKMVKVPYRVDDVIKQKCDATAIINIYPGRESTTIICE